MKKIVIRIITYNQQNTISRALDSVLCQKEWGLYRIVVSDDCSKDRTWEILTEYQRKYPDLVYIYRNQHNLGIYGNVAKADCYLPEYDLFGSLAGDDEYCNGYFKGIQNLIDELRIDTSEAVGIFSDWISVDTSGVEIVHKQEAAISKYNLWSLKSRGLISSRSLLTSKKVHDSFEPLLIGKGLNLTESHRDSQSILNIEKAYYLPQVTSKYYIGIGVAARLSLEHSDYLTNQAVEKWEYAIEYYVHNKRDMHYAQYELLKAYHYIKPSFCKLFKMFYHYELGQLPGYRKSFRANARLFWNLSKYILVRK